MSDETQAVAASPAETVPAETIPASVVSPAAAMAAMNESIGIKASEPVQVAGTVITTNPPSFVPASEPDLTAGETIYVAPEFTVPPGVTPAVTLHMSTDDFNDLPPADEAEAMIKAPSPKMGPEVAAPPPKKWFKAVLGAGPHGVPKSTSVFVLSLDKHAANLAACERLGIHWNHANAAPHSPWNWEIFECDKPALEQLTQYGYYTPAEAGALLA